MPTAKTHSLPEGFSLKNGTLFFKKQEAKYYARTMRQMQPLLHQKSSLPGDTITYKMSRGIWQDGNIRFDVTILPPLSLGDERNKTFGHYHPQSKYNAPYPEIYEVLSGEAHFLMQTHNPQDASRIERALLVGARAGEKALMQPYFGHITINAGKTPLVLANLVSANFSSDYSAYEKLRGGAYYELADSSLIPNLNCIPCPLEKMDATGLAASFHHPLFKEPLFSLAQKDISQFSFLENPLLLMKK